MDKNIDNLTGTESLDELEARLDDVKTCLKAVEERP